MIKLYTNIIPFKFAYFQTMKLQIQYGIQITLYSNRYKKNICRKTFNPTDNTLSTICLSIFKCQMPSSLGRFGWSLTREIKSSIAFSFQLSLDGDLPEESGVPQPWVHSWVWMVTYQRNLEFPQPWVHSWVWMVTYQRNLEFPQPWVHSWVWMVTYQRNLEFHSLEFTVEFG